MQDIILLGAEYEDVPAVNLPAVGGGTAKFTDTTPVTAEDGDVAAGKIYVKSNGELSTGTASGGSAVIEALSVTANGTYTAPVGVDGYSPVTVNVSGGGGGAVSESDVNFYDYDGTLVASHTKAEINAMSSDSDLPANPSHTGLTAQGWNWALAQLKTQLTAMPDQPVSVGQMYVTDDDKTRIYVHFEQGRTSPYLGICPKGTVTIDWGDGSATSTLTGTSLTTAKTVQHTYAAAGDYVIKLTAASGTTFAFTGSSTAAYLLMFSNSPSTTGIVYSNTISKIELGSAARIGNYAFYRCQALRTLTVPATVSSFGSYPFYTCYSLVGLVVPSGAARPPAFRNCYSLQFVSLPASITEIGQYGFGTCYPLTEISMPSGVTSFVSYALQNDVNLKRVHLPSSLTSIGNSALSSCSKIANITIPSGVTSIGASAFSNCFGLGEIHFKPTTPPTVSNSNAWTSVPSDCKIYIPTGSLSAYTSATNYPSSSTYTYVEE